MQTNNMFNLKMTPMTKKKKREMMKKTTRENRIPGMNEEHTSKM